MKLTTHLLCACLTTGLVACAELPRTSDGSGAYRADVSQEESERRILIAFGDRTIARAPLGDAASTYRRRGQGYSTSTFSSHLVQDLADQYRLKRISDWPVTALGMHCVVFEVAAGASVDGVIKAVEKDSRVKLVQSLRRFRVLNDPYSQLQPALDSMHIRDAHRWTTGQGVTIAIIDTGVDRSHPDLQGQVAADMDLVNEDGNSARKGDIHGTAVAGVIAAIANNNEGIVGVAPSAKLLTYRACWQHSSAAAESTCDSFTLAKALNNAIMKRPQVVNLSLTGPHDPLLDLLVKKALNEGIIVVAAAPDGSKQGDEGFPASVSGVIAVQTAGSAAGGTPSLNSHLYAPGVQVLTTFPQRAYNFISGNSFAAAHISGVVALLLALKPDLTRTHLTDILLRSIEPSNQIGKAKSASTSWQINVSSAIKCVKARGDCGFARAQS
jgi:subtilisin family serine protease